MKKDEGTVYVQYDGPDKGFDPDGTMHFRFRWRIPAQSRIWDDLVNRYPTPTAALTGFQRVMSQAHGHGNKVTFERVTI